MQGINLFDTIRISAIICTHNREKTLKNAIQSLIHQTLDASLYEIIVVDNASTDRTAEIAGEFSFVENFTYVYEPRLGLSYARNTGVDRASGRIVAFIDDDAIASTDWMEKILKAFSDIPCAGAVGGKVEPVWEVPPPPWLCDFMQFALSLLDWSEEPLELGTDQFLIGTNMAIPRDLLIRYGAFTPLLGRKGNNLISSEEIELIEKIRDSGRTIYYDPGILVQHFVPSARLKQSWFKKRWFAEGVSDATMYCLKNNPSKACMLKMAMKTLINVLKNPLGACIGILPITYKRKFKKAYRSIVNIGFLWGIVAASFGSIKTNSHNVRGNV